MGLLNAAKNEMHGRSSAEVDEIFRHADVFVNLGVNRMAIVRSRRREFTSTSIPFTQIRLENGNAHLRDLIADHNLFFTYGRTSERQQLATDGGHRLSLTRPPVVGDFCRRPCLRQSCVYDDR